MRLNRSLLDEAPLLHPRIASLALAFAVFSIHGFSFHGHTTLAGEFNPVLSIGDQAPAWNELPGVDGKKHSSESLADKQVLVVAFTCNSCPYAVDAEKRLIALVEKYSDKSVALTAINVNLVAEDLLPAMQDRGKAVGMNYPYLFDESQQIAKSFGAKYTPEFFVFDGERKLVYQGSLDDSPDGKNVTKQYVTDAIDAVLSDKRPTVTETVPIGCRIRFKRERRTRKK